MGLKKKKKDNKDFTLLPRYDHLKLTGSLLCCKIELTCFH